jgi:hypothetical protein
MNPLYCGRPMYGLACTGLGCLYIAAKNLLDPTLKFKVYGTLVHELFHQALKMLYNNDCKPYKKGNNARMQEYRNAIRMSKLIDHNEPVFERALRITLDDDEDEQEAEAIVRPAHVTALYMNDDEKRQEIEANYPELYVFYRTRVLPDIDRALKKLQKKQNVPIGANDVEYFENIRKLKKRYQRLWLATVVIGILLLLSVCGFGWHYFTWTAAINQIETINEEFFGGYEWLQLTSETVNSFNLNVDATHNTLHFKSNCVLMTILAIYQTLSNDNSLHKNFIVNFDDASDDLTGKKFWKLHQSRLQPTMIVNCSGVDMTRLSSFLTAHSTDRIILVSDDSINFENISPVRLNHSFTQLTKESQEKCLNGVSEKMFPLNFAYYGKHKTFTAKPSFPFKSAIINI